MTSSLHVYLLIGGCLALFAAHFYRRPKVDPLDPAVIVFGLFFYSVLLKAFYIYWLRPPDIIRDLGFRYDRMFMGEDRSILVFGMLLIFFALACYLAGLQNKKALSINARFLRESEIEPKFVTIIAIGAALASFAGLLLFLDQTGGVDADRIFTKKFNDIPGGATQRFFHFEYWLFKATTLVKCAFYAMLVVWIAQGERVNRKFYIVLLATFALSVLGASLAGNRSTSVLFLAEFAVLWFVRPTSKSARLYLSLAALLFILIGLTSNSRYAVMVSEIGRDPTYSDGTTPRKGGPEAVNSEWTPGILPLSVHRRLEIIGQRRYGFDILKTSHIVNKVPKDLPYYKGQTFVGWLFFFLPERVWPSKPEFAGVSSVLSEKVFEQPDNNVPPGIVAESYLNFGWSGVVVLTLVGALTALIANTVRQNLASATVQIFGAVALTRMTIIMFSTSFGDAILKTLADLVPTAIVLALAWWLSTSRGRQVVPK